MRSPRRQVIASASILLVLASLGCQGRLSRPASLPRVHRFDLGPVNGRRDTATLGWTSWAVADGRQARWEQAGLRLTLRQADPNGPALQGRWVKKLLASGATLACDGVQVPAGGIELVLEGLPPGLHSLATYHGTLDGRPSSMPSYRLVAGSSETPVGPIPHRVGDNERLATGFVRFRVSGSQAVRVRISTDSTDGPVILNGFVIDGGDPQRQVGHPQPTPGDLHVAADGGHLTLRWTDRLGKRRYHVYLHRDLDEQAARRPLGNRVPRDLYYSTETDVASVRVPVDPNDSRWVYAWRVDAVDSNGQVDFGEVWTFRIRHLAFPGAEGYGRLALGGRGGRVFHVTTLADHGPGSLREAVEAEGPRTVVFDVGGLISLESKLIIRNPFLTIAGQTAPGKGICIRNFSVGCLGTHDIILRHLRVRLGDLAGQTMDGMGLASSDHCIVDHCSISWTQDEAFSSRGARNITVQWCLISEALNIAGHRKYAPGTQHGYAASIGGNVGSFHHNLLAHCDGRNWSLAGGLDLASRHTGRLDIRNNLVYNWAHRTTDGGAQEVQFVNNYYKPGPASRVFHVLKPERENVAAFGPQDYYVTGNILEGHSDPNDPLSCVVEPKGEPLSNFVHDQPFFRPYVHTDTATEAYERVLEQAGCNVPTLDDHDKRIIKEVRRGIALYQGSRSGLPGLPDTQADVGGWEDYPEIHRPADWDRDRDGMPDHWELEQGFDPDDPADGTSDADGDGYTNLEEYLNDLAGTSS